jgi:hypothetical protein
VSVCAEGHRVRFVKTAGRTLEGGTEGEQEGAAHRVAMEAGDRPRLPLGVELAHPWAETVELPLNYLVDGFVRKRARNDYPMLALWELGIGFVRVPAADLLETATVARIELLRRHGCEIGVLVLGVPDGPLAECLCARAGLVDALEIVLPAEELPDSGETLRALRDRVSVPVFVSPLETSAGTLEALTKGVYAVRHGFRCDQTGREQTLGALRGALGVDGFSFRVTAAEGPSETVSRVAALMQRLGCGACVTVQIAADSPAEAVEDDRVIADRVAEAAAAARKFPHVRVILDTFADVDRGYYVRHGLVDRRYNLRTAGAVLTRQL